MLSCCRVSRRLGQGRDINHDSSLRPRPMLPHPPSGGSLATPCGVGATGAGHGTTRPVWIHLGGGDPRGSTMAMVTGSARDPGAMARTTGNGSHPGSPGLQREVLSRLLHAAARSTRIGSSSAMITGWPAALARRRRRCSAAGRCRRSPQRRSPRRRPAAPVLGATRGALLHGGGCHVHEGLVVGEHRVGGEHERSTSEVGVHASGLDDLHPDAQ